MAGARRAATGTGVGAWPSKPFRLAGRICRTIFPPPPGNSFPAASPAPGSSGPRKWRPAKGVRPGFRAAGSTSAARTTSHRQTRRNYPACRSARRPGFRPGRGQVFFERGDGIARVRRARCFRTREKSGAGSARRSTLPLGVAAAAQRHERRRHHVIRQFVLKVGTQPRRERGVHFTVLAAPGRPRQTPGRVGWRTRQAPCLKSRREPRKPAPRRRDGKSPRSCRPRPPLPPKS